MPSKPAWIDERAEVLLRHLSDLGMSLSTAAAAELIEERVEFVAVQMRIGTPAARHYLSDEALQRLAESIAFSMAEEAPGADVLASPRTAEVPVAVLGRAVSALAEAILIRMFERDDVEHLRATIAQLTQALSSVGLVLSDHQDTDAAVARFPPSLLFRVARSLEAAADMAAEGVLPPDFDPANGEGLVSAFRRDAATLRNLAD